MLSIIIWAFVFLALSVAIIHFFIKGLLLVGTLLLIIGLLLGAFLLIINALAGFADSFASAFWKR
jgi:hypothetical protein